MYRAILSRQTAVRCRSKSITDCITYGELFARLWEQDIRIYVQKTRYTGEWYFVTNLDPDRKKVFVPTWREAADMAVEEALKDLDENGRSKSPFVICS